MSSPTNNNRAEWAQVAVDAFAEVTGMDEDSEELDTIIGDLFCNLRHLCAGRKEIDLESKWQNSEIVFN